MAKRRSLEELKNVSTAHMTPEEYRRSDTPGVYDVVDASGTRMRASGLHSAKVLAGEGGTITRIGGDDRA